MADPTTDPESGAPLGSGLPTDTNSSTTGGAPTTTGQDTGNGISSGSILQTLFGSGASTVGAIGNLLGIGGQVGAAALYNAHLNDAINYLKGIGGQAGYMGQTSYPAGWNAFANQNNLTGGIANGSNPYMSLLQNGVVGNIASLNNLLPGLTVSAGNMLYSDPTMAAYLGLQTRPTDFLTGQAQAAGNIVGSGGQTAQNSYIAQRANTLAGMNPLLSMGQAGSMALDQAGRQNAAAAQTARAQALARGGGAGAVAGAGAQNGGMADFSDAALGNISGTFQNALNNQQGLNLSQVLGGLNAGQGAGALQQSLLGTGFTQGTNNALAASGLSQQAIQELMQGQLGASSIGNLLAQLYQGQNSQLGGAAGQGINAFLGAGSLMGNQGGAFLNNAANAMNTYANTGGSIAKMMQQSPWANLLTNLGAMTTGAGGGSGINWGQLIGTGLNAAGKVAQTLGGGGGLGGNQFGLPFNPGFDPGGFSTMDGLGNLGGGFGFGAPGGGGAPGGIDPSNLMFGT